MIAPDGKCSAKRLLALRKSLNVNDLIFQTVEDGLKLTRIYEMPNAKLPEFNRDLIGDKLAFA